MTAESHFVLRRPSPGPAFSPTAPPTSVPAHPSAVPEQRRRQGTNRPAPLAGGGHATPRSAAAPAANRRLVSEVLEVAAVVVAALASAWFVFGFSGAVLGAVVAWATLVYCSGYSVASPFLPSLQPLAHHALSVLGVVALVALTEHVQPAAVPATAVGVLAGTAAALVARTARRARRGPVRTILVGDASSVTQMLTRWHPASPVDVVAVCIPDTAHGTDRHVRSTFPGAVIASLDAVPAQAERLGAEVVSVAPGPGVPPESVRRLGWMLEDLPVHLGVVGLPDTVAPHRIGAGRLGRHPVVELRRCRTSWVHRFTKAAIDRVVGSLLLLTAMPVFAVLVLLIRLDSPGPAIFRQTRVGVRGREFTLYKLRTMRPNAEALRDDLEPDRPNAMLFKLENDPRITRLGRHLRRFSLDELPQLANIAKGDMSLVGPRPALPEEVARYDEAARRRLAVKPGLTGLWQVSGRSDLTWEDSLALDLLYVDNWRLTDDALIAGRTFRAVLTSRGAY